MDDINVDIGKSFSKSEKLKKAQQNCLKPATANSDFVIIGIILGISGWMPSFPKIIELCYLREIDAGYLKLRVHNLHIITLCFLSPLYPCVSISSMLQ